MPWVQRGAWRYYYRTERNSGRAVRKYVGTGTAGELAAAADELRRVERAIATRDRQEQEARYNTTVAPLLELCESTDVLARAALVAAGFHQHARGKWRRERERKSPD